MDWKDIGTLSRLSTGQGKMFSRKRSGNCARHQRMFKMAVKHARFMALLPYVAELAKADLTLDFDAARLPDPIRQATILWRGRLTPDYAYMQSFV